MNYLSKLQKPSETARKQYINWLAKSRPKQIHPSGDWNVWLILAGRGWGKTRTGAQDIVHYGSTNNNVRCAVVAPTFGDLRRVCFEGDSGILSIVPEECYYKGSRSKGYYKSGVEIYLYNGSRIQGYAAIEPDRFRGPQYHRAWCDELASWRYPEAYDQLQFGLRLGLKPQTVITTTPRPTELIKNIMKREDAVITSGDTFENKDNLAPSALQAFKERYEGTRLGRQELYAEILDDFEGALWSFSMIEKQRTRTLPEMKRVVKGIDPAVTNNIHSDETGIIVAGKGVVDKYYIIDAVDGKMTADNWARVSINAYHKYQANMLIAEVNNGGDLVERVIRGIDNTVKYKSVSATRGKLVRAEPISALYEQGKVSHCGSFKVLEDQMCSYTGDRHKSPDRLDAMVWAMTELTSSSKQAMWRIT